MARLALRIIATLVVAIVLLGAVYSIALGSLAGFGDAVHHLFLFMDIGIGLWIVLLVIFQLRRRPASVSMTVLLALIGVVANFLTVTIVGLVQQGGAPEFMRWALEAGLAFLIATAIVVSLSIRLVPPHG